MPYTIIFNDKKYENYDLTLYTPEHHLQNFVVDINKPLETDNVFFTLLLIFRPRIEILENGRMTMNGFAPTDFDPYQSLLDAFDYKTYRYVIIEFIKENENKQTTYVTIPYYEGKLFQFFSLKSDSYSRIEDGYRMKLKSVQDHEEKEIMIFRPDYDSTIHDGMLISGFVPELKVDGQVNQDERCLYTYESFVLAGE